MSIADTKEMIGREGWLSRFYGFMGSYQYRKETKGRDFYDILVEQGENSQVQLDGVELLADNIVYIYGVPQGGKSKFVKALADNLGEEKAYFFAGIDMSDMSNNQNLAEIQKALKLEFEKYGFSFPSLNMSEQEQDIAKACTSTLSEILDLFENVEEFASGGIIKKIRIAKDYFRNAQEKKKAIDAITPMDETVYCELLDDLERRAKAGCAGKIFDKNDPFKYFKFDLRANVTRKKEQVVCVIDNFEKYEAWIEDVNVRRYFFQLMSASLDVVWVLCSGEKPDEMIRKYVRVENQWRMGGLDEAEARRYLEQNCEFLWEEWYEGVYKYTGGYIGLMDLCISAHNAISTAGGKREPGKLNFDMWSIRFAKAKLMDVDEHGYAEKKADREWIVEAWIKEVWKTSGNNGESVIEILLQKEFDLANNTDYSKNNDSKFLLPCICYLVDKTESDGKGRISGQYYWKRHDGVRENGNEDKEGLSAAGYGCMKAIENNTPFCIDSVEVPGYVYFDPVLIQIIRNHKRYEEWLGIFAEYCTRKAEAENQQKENSTAYVGEANSIKDGRYGDFENERNAEVHNVVKHRPHMEGSQPEPGHNEMANEEVSKEQIESEASEAGQGAAPADSPSPEAMGSVPVAGKALSDVEIPQDSQIGEKATEVKTQSEDKNTAVNLNEQNAESNDPKDEKKPRTDEKKIADFSAFVKNKHANGGKFGGGKK